MKIEERIKEKYIIALKENIKTEKIGGEIIFSLPFYISGGHFLEISVTPLQGNYIKLSDKSRTIGDLFLSGLNIKGKNERRIKEIIKRFNLQINENYEIIAAGKMEEAGKIIHQVILAAIQIGSLEILREIKLYKEEKIVRNVRKIIEETKIPFKYGPRAILPGKELQTIQFDFLIENGNLRAIKTIDRKTGIDTYVEAWAFKLDDITKIYRDIRKIIIYNPENNQWYKYSNILEKRAETIPFDKKEIIKAIS
ncbi:DUF1828 domain-containing protein [bacterium]|nr:DUF1828 domain-containing protein [bacterium]